MNDLSRFYYQVFLNVYLALGQHAILVIALFAAAMRLLFYSYDRQVMALNLRRVEADREVLQRTQTYRLSGERIMQERARTYQRHSVSLDALLNWMFIQLCILSVGGAVFGYWGKLIPLRPNLNMLTLPWQSLTVPDPQFLWLNLNTTDPTVWALPLIVIVVTLIQRQIVLQGKKVPFMPWSAPVIMGVMAFSLPAGASILWLCLMVFDIIVLPLHQGSLKQLPNPLTLFNPRGRRRIRVRRALSEGAKLTPEAFEAALAGMFRPPTLNKDDAALYYDLLLRDARSLTKAKSEPAAILLRKRALNHLAHLGTGSNTDLATIYHELGRKQGEFGNSISAIELAVQGYHCAQGTRASRANCAVLLVKYHALTPDAQKVFQAFVKDYPPLSTEYQNFVKALAAECAVDLKLTEAKLREHLSLNELASRLFAAGWPKSNLGLIHLLLKDPVRAEPYLIQAMNATPGEFSAAFCLALIQIRRQQWKESDETLRRVTPARGAVDPGLQALARLREALMWLNGVPVEAPPSTDIQSWRAALQKQFRLRPLAKAELDYVQGRLEALWGDWKNAGTLLEAAYNADKLNTQVCYHYITYLQINGEWQKAQKALPTVPSSAPELACLNLKHAHPSARPPLGGAKPASQPLDDTLVRAKQDLLSGRAAEIKPLPTTIRLNTPEQSQEWARIWIGALIGRQDTSNARHSLTSDAATWLMKPERGFFEAAIHWLEGDLDQAQTLIVEVLKSAPLYDSALRLAGAVAEANGDPKRAAGYWGTLQKALPQPDPNLPLREALAHWRAGDLTQAAALLAKLEKSRIGTAFDPQVLMWQGRILLQQRAFTKARPVFERAKGLNHPEAPWYLWLCDAIEQRDPKRGWGATKAIALLGALPNGGETLEDIPVPEVASVAALVSLESGRANEMLTGLTWMVHRFGAEQERGAGLPDTQRDNLIEALWRCALSFSTQKHNAALIKLVGEVEKAFPQLSVVTEQVMGAISAGSLARLIKEDKPKTTTLKQIETMIKASPQLPLPRLAHFKVRVQSGEITVEQAHQELTTPENQTWLAKALETAIRLNADDPEGKASYSLGLASFLSLHQGALEDLSGTLRILLPDLPEEREMRHEGALCAALAGLRQEAFELFQTTQAQTKGLVSPELLADYACYAAAETASAHEGEQNPDLDEAQRYVTMARSLQEGSSS